MRVSHIKILDDGTKVFMRADAEPGATREQVIAELERAFEAIRNGDFEHIDIEDIDGHLPMVNLKEL